MTTAVRPASSRRRPSSMRPSVCRSTLEVASSRIRIARVGGQRAGERDELALAGGQLRAALADRRVVAVLERHDELVGADGVRGGADLLARRVGPAEGDVLGDRAAEQKALLRDDAELAAQRRLRDVAQVVAVDEHRAARRVVEARDELGDRRLAGAGRADERDGLARRDLQREVLQRPHRVLARRRSEKPTSRSSISPRRRPSSIASGASTRSDSSSSRSKILSSAAMPAW